MTPRRRVVPGALAMAASSVRAQPRRKRVAIIDFAAARRLPAIHQSRELTDGDGLIAYGVDLAQLYRGFGDYVDRILRGASPGDLPIEQPTRFELVINRRTARALGLVMPPKLLLRGDELID